MKLSVVAAALLAAVLATGALVAQQPPEFPGAQKEHQILKKFVGEWDSTGTALTGPDQPAVACDGTIRGRMLGDVWVINELENNVMGVQMKGVQTIGYDPAKKKYIGTWVDSMLSHLWHYEGTLDESGKILTLEAEGPNFTEPGKMAKYRDSYEFKADGHIVARSSMQGPDGKWIEFMKGDAKRKE